MIDSANSIANEIASRSGPGVRVKQIEGEVQTAFIYDGDNDLSFIDEIVDQLAGKECQIWVEAEDRRELHGTLYKLHILWVDLRSDESSELRETAPEWPVAAGSSTFGTESSLKLDASADHRTLPGSGEDPEASE